MTTLTTQKTLRTWMVRAAVAVTAVAVTAVAGCTSTPPAPIDPGAAGSAAATTGAPAPTNTVAASGGTEPSAATGTGGGAVTNCQPGELTASLGQEEGAAGSTTVPLLLTNKGTRTCELRGFPGVSYVTGDDGHQVGPAAAMSGERGGEVALTPGAAAKTLLKLVNVQNYDAAVCMPTAVRGLRIYPPGDTASLYVARAGTGCAGTPPGDQIAVQTLTAA